jgi:hypothetical protein
MKLTTVYLMAFVCLLLITWAHAEGPPQSSPRAQAEAAFVSAQKALARGDSDAAESYLKEALTEDPTFTSAIWQLAQIYESRGKLDYTRELMLRGLKQDPQATWAKEKLAALEAKIEQAARSATLDREAAQARKLEKQTVTAPAKEQLVPAPAAEKQPAPVPAEEKPVEAPAVKQPAIASAVKQPVMAAAEGNRAAPAEEGRKTLDKSKGTPSAVSTFFRGGISLLVLAAVLCAFIIDIRRRTKRKDCPLEGDLDILPIVDVVSLVTSNLRTGRLIIESPDTKGEICFDDGTIIHAQCNQLSGKNAFHKLMALRAGRFFYHNQLPKTHRTIKEPLSLLLLSIQPYERGADTAPKDPAARDKTAAKPEKTVVS